MCLNECNGGSREIQFQSTQHNTDVVKSPRYPSKLNVNKCKNSLSGHKNLRDILPPGYFVTAWIAMITTSQTSGRIPPSYAFSPWTPQVNSAVCFHLAFSSTLGIYLLKYCMFSCFPKLFFSGVIQMLNLWPYTCMEAKVNLLLEQDFELFC